jgi:hypothetical protein
MTLIQRIDKQMGRHTWYPNDTISSDWDVLQAIISTLKLFHRPPLVSHLKGHQDDTTTYDLLPIEAQLNVDADAAATLFQMEHGAMRYIVPIIAGNTAQLVINNKTVTYGYVKTIRNAYAEPLLKKYIGMCNQWSDLEMSTIDWTSLGTACTTAIMPGDTSSSSYHTIYSLRESALRSTTPRAQHTVYAVTKQTKTEIISCGATMRHAQPGEPNFSGLSGPEEKHFKQIQYCYRSLSRIFTPGLIAPLHHLLQHIQPLTGGSCASKRIWDAASALQWSMVYRVGMITR